MKHQDVKGFEVVGYQGNGTTISGEPMFWELQLRDKDGRFYKVRAARLTKTNIYVSQMKAGCE